MSHIDEGLLHAYLDGALEDYPPGTARRVRAHVERCAVCAESLEDARRLRDEVEVILALPEVDTSLPPLEELRRRARTSEVTSGPARVRLHRLHRLGWAASVVLALGAGWSLRGDRGPRPEFEAAGPAATATAPMDVGTDRTEASPIAASAPDGPRAEVEQGPDRGVEPAGEVLSVPAPPIALVAQAAPDDAIPLSPADALSALEPGPAPVLPMPEARSLASAEGIVTNVADPSLAGGAPSATADEREATDREERSRSDGARIALAARADGAQVGLTGGGRIAGGYDAAEEGDRKRGDGSEPGSLVVPGLEVLSIVWREEGVTPAGVRVLQRMEDGGTLELIHLPEGVEPSSVAPAEGGVRELVVPREQGWVILRATVDDAVLLELLRRLDEPIEP